MTFTKDELRFLIANVQDFMNPELMDIPNKIKFMLMYLNSMVGRSETGCIYDFKYLKQKDIKDADIPELDESSLEFYARLYNYVNLALNAPDALNEYVSNVHVASIIYEAVHFFILEELETLNGVSFREHEVELVDNPSAEDIVKLYQTRMGHEDPIRNFMKLAFVRNHHLVARFEGCKRIELYRYNKD